MLPHAQVHPEQWRNRLRPIAAVPRVRPLLVIGWGMGLWLAVTVVTAAVMALLAAASTHTSNAAEVTGAAAMAALLTGAILFPITVVGVGVVLLVRLSRTKIIAHRMTP